MLWKIIEVDDFFILLICKFRQYKVVNIANFVVLRENSYDGIAFILLLIKILHGGLTEYMQQGIQ